MVTASVTYGCSLCHVRLQVLIGLLGSFEEGFNLFLRILAIVGTSCYLPLTTYDLLLAAYSPS